MSWLSTGKVDLCCTKKIGLVMAQCKTHTSCIQCTALNGGEKSFSWGLTAQHHPSNPGLTNCSTDYPCYKVGWRVPASTEVLLSILKFQAALKWSKSVLDLIFHPCQNTVFLAYMSISVWLTLGSRELKSCQTCFILTFICAMKSKDLFFSLFLSYVIHSVLSLWHWNPSRCWPWCTH